VKIKAAPDTTDVTDDRSNGVTVSRRPFPLAAMGVLVHATVDVLADPPEPSRS
jgi:hypothetical protein